MIASFQEVFRPTPEQKRKQEEFFQKLIQDAIDDHDCYYCKHAALREHWEHSYFSGYDAWCQLDGQDEYCNGRTGIEMDQRCMFWEYSDPEERYE